MSDEFLDRWVDVTEALPWLSYEPFFVEEGRHDEVVERLSGSGLSMTEIDISHVRDEDGLLRQLGKSLSFPAYYGANWDAFLDLLRQQCTPSPMYRVLLLLSCEGFLGSDLHGFVRSVCTLSSIAANLSHVDNPYGQLDVMYLAPWSTLKAVQR